MEVEPDAGRWLADMSGRPLGTGRAGAANVMTGFDAAAQNIISAAQAAVDDAGLDRRVVTEASAFLGLAGANIGDYSRRISGILPFRQSRIATDAEISMQGAIGNDDGVVAIIGTGSVFVCRLNKIVRNRWWLGLHRWRSWQWRPAWPCAVAGDPAGL